VSPVISWNIYTTNLNSDDDTRTNKSKLTVMGTLAEMMIAQQVR